MKLWSSFDRKEGHLYLRPQIWIWMFVCGGHFVFTSGDLELNTPGDYSGSFDPLNCLIFRKDGTCETEESAVSNTIVSRRKVCVCVWGSGGELQDPCESPVGHISVWN